MFDNLKKKIAKGAVAASKGISKAVGAGDLVDYAGSKLAKRAAAPDAKKFVDDKTSGVRAAISGVMTATSLTGIGAGPALARGVAKGFANHVGKKAANEALKKSIAKKATEGAMSAKRGAMTKQLNKFHKSPEYAGKLKEARKIMVKSSTPNTSVGKTIGSKYQTVDASGKAGSLTKTLSFKK